MKPAQAAARCRRALIGYIEEARHALRLRHPSDESVHVARKAIKKARAALRLLRGTLGEASYQHENAALRDAGRRLSPLRDAKSMAEMFRALRERHVSRLRHAQALAVQLDENLRARRRELSRKPAALRACKGMLTACRARIARRHPGGSRREVLEGLRRIYRRGRRSLAASRRAGTPEALHEWRKQVKYLSNALKILDGGSSAGGAKLGGRAEELADILGEDHDLAELDRHVAARGRADSVAHVRENLWALIARRRAKLQKRAYSLGAKIYARTPASFLVAVQKHGLSTD